MSSNTPTRSPTRTSPRQRQRALAKTTYSSSRCVPRSARPRGSTTQRSRPSRRRRKGVGMRLAILDSGHRVPMKGKFVVIRTVSRLPVPDAVKTNRYRPDFYGTPMGVLTQEAMRGPSAWSVGDRELMGASVSQINRCEVCTKTHAGVAALAYQDEAKVSAALADLETAPIKEPLRATMRMERIAGMEIPIPTRAEQDRIAEPHHQQPGFAARSPRS